MSHGNESIDIANWVDTLGPLADIICDLEQRRSVTPVLVTDPRLVLADDFYVQLCEAVAQRVGRPVRLDLLPGHRLSLWGTVSLLNVGPWLPAPIASAIFSPMRKMSLKRLAKRLPTRARIEYTVAVARPGGTLRELVIGLAGPHDQLPSFAEEVSLDVGLARNAA
jgi:hypothetical protein